MDLDKNDLSVKNHKRSQSSIKIRKTSWRSSDALGLLSCSSRCTTDINYSYTWSEAPNKFEAENKLGFTIKNSSLNKEKHKC